jgi:hypothetical protein
MPTEDPTPPSTKVAGTTPALVSIYGDTMIDHYLSTREARTDHERVNCTNRGMYMGGSARIATYLSTLLDIRNNNAYYFSPAFPSADFCLHLSAMPQGPFMPNDLEWDKLAVDWGQVCTKIRLLDFVATQSRVVHFLSVDEQDYNPTGEEPEKPTTRWHEGFPLEPSRIVLFSDYNKGAITPDLIEDVLKFSTHNLQLAIYDGFDYERAERVVAHAPAHSQVVIKGSRSQWYRLLVAPKKDNQTSVDKVCEMILERAVNNNVVIILTDEHRPATVYSCLGKLQTKSSVPPVRIDPQTLPHICTNGAGDLLAAHLVYRWSLIDLSQKYAVLSSIGNHLSDSMKEVRKLLHYRQIHDNPILEPWHMTNDPDNDEAVQSDSVPEPPVRQRSSESPGSL